MSRYTIFLDSEGTKTFNYGFDHALGYFYDIFDEIEEKIIEEKCSKFDNLTGFELADKMENTIPKDVLARLVDKLTKMKLDFAF